jgi:signal transduction histidine kinase/ligand-binding sensor domain-containing protein
LKFPLNLSLAGSLIIIFSAACHNNDVNIPFPETETEFARPQSVPLVFSDPKNIHWEKPIPDSIKPVAESKIDFKKLPSKPFDIGSFTPLGKPLELLSSNINRLPDTSYDLNNLPSKKFTYSVSLIAQPIRIKALRPRVEEKSALTIFNYGLDQGFSSGGATGAIMKDSRGFLWIGSLNGLYRYDGENFDLYSTAQGLNAISGTESLYEDSHGQIWITGGNGVDVLSPELGIVKHLDTARGLLDNGTKYVLEDSSGNIWIATDKGVNIINPQRDSIRALTTMQGLSSDGVLTFLDEGNGNIGIGTEKGVNIVNQQKKSLKHLTKSEGLLNDFAWILRKDKNGLIWIGTLGGVNIFDPEHGKLTGLTKNQGLTSDHIREIFIDNLGQTWIACSNGIDIISSDGLNIRRMGVVDGLTTGIDRMFEEHGLVWTTDGYARLNVFDATGNEMFRQFGENQGIEQGAVRHLYEDSEHRVWIDNSRRTIDIADYKNGRILHIDSAQGWRNVPAGFLEAEKNQIWIGTYGMKGQQGIYIYNPETGTLKHLTKSNGLKSDAAWGSLKDKNGNIWLWGDTGLTEYDPKNKTFRYLTAKGGLSYNNIQSCIQDDNGNIWIGTDNSVEVLDPSKDIIRQLVIGNGKKMVAGLKVLAKDNSGKIYLGFYGYGFYIINPIKNLLTNISMKEGLVNDQVTSLLVKNGSIYAGTADGLSIFTPDDRADDSTGWQTKSYGKPQLFNHVDFNPTVLLTSNNQIWWGDGADGILIMNEPIKQQRISRTYITGIDIMEQTQSFLNSSGYLKTNHISWDSITGPYSVPLGLILPYDQNLIKFYFSGTHLWGVDKTRYRYILEGKDKSWSTITAQAFASYVNLKPGNYQFKVASRGIDGIWSAPAELAFTINPPWWQTWWAYLLFIITAGIIVWGGFTVYRTNQVKAENLRLEEKVFLRTKELGQSLEELKETQTLLIQQEKMASLGELTAGIAHEIQNPLNFVNNFSEVNKELIEEMKQELVAGNIAEATTIANNVQQNEDKINHHGRRADAIVKGMLQHSRTGAGQKEPTDLNTLADEYLRLTYHGLKAKDKSFNVSMKTDFDKNIGKINIIPQDIGRVLLNLYSNAFYALAEKKKLQSGHFEPFISVGTKKINNKVEIRVKDNGNGIPQKVQNKIFQPFFTTKPTGQGTGLGLSLSYDIVKAHGGELKVESQEGAGAEFVVLIPVS